MLLNDAVAKVEEELGNDENVQIMLNFIKSSNRGIAR